jgi:hypothetical protein
MSVKKDETKSEFKSTTTTTTTIPQADVLPMVMRHYRQTG